MKHDVFKIMVSVLISLMAFTASAEKCYEPSPNFSENEDEYYDLEMKNKLSRDEIKSLKALSKGLKGEWRGSAVAVTCTGTERNPKSKSAKSKVTAHITKGMENVVVLKADMYIKAKKTTTSANMHLLRHDNMFYAKFTGDSSVVYSEKYRRRTGVGSHLVETINSIQKNDKKLNLKIHHYINGVLVGHEQWSLSKR